MRTKGFPLILVLLFLSPPIPAVADGGIPDVIQDPLDSGKSVSPLGAAGTGLDSFKTDLFTGSGTYAVPIAVPPGTAGMQPQLALTYSSGAGNGWAGFGWSLDVPSIHRSLKKGIPRYIDDPGDPDHDRFDYGDSTLVMDVDGNLHTENESFVGIMRAGVGTAADAWVVITKTGAMHTFGGDAAHQVAHPTNGMIYNWLLAKTEDLHGNSMEYTYDLTSNPGRAYLKQIVYTKHGGVVVGSARTVTFCLEGDPACDPGGATARPDVLTDARPGFITTTSRRLKKIDITVGSSLVRRYVLSYATSPDSGRSLLASVAIVGADGTTSLPPFTFSYTSNVTDGTSGWDSSSSSAFVSPIDFATSTGIDKGVRFGDLNGDGMTDISWQATENTCSAGIPHNETYLGARSGWPSAASADWQTSWGTYQVTNCPAGCGGIFNPCTSFQGFTDSFQRLADVNADGRDDLASGTRLNLNRNFFTPGPAAPISFNNTGAMVLDVNGDGLTDFLSSIEGGTAHAWLNQNATSFVSSDNWAPPTEMADTNGKDRGVRFADVNGDGLVDIVQANTGSHLNNFRQVWLNNGTGFQQDASWTATLSAVLNTDGTNYFSDSGVDRGYRLIDTNGDGLVDIVRFRDNEPAHVWLNNGSAWVLSSAWVPPFAFVKSGGSGTGARLFDANGDGMPDFVRAKQGETRETRLNLAHHVDQLKMATNPLAGKVTITFRPSTDFQHVDASGNPTLPMVLSVVATTTVDDGQGAPATMTYSYGSGTYNPALREFRGFGYVRTISPTGTVTDTYFRAEDELKGQIKRQKTGVLNGSTFVIYQQTDFTYAYAKGSDLSTFTINANDTLSTLDPSDPTNQTFQTFHLMFGGSEASLVHLALRIRVDEYSFNPSNQTQKKQRATTWEYDAFGNVGAEKQLGDASKTGDERFTFMQYTIPFDPDLYLVGLPCRTYVTLGSNSEADKVSEQRVYYDGLSLCDASIGDATQRQTWLRDPFDLGPGTYLTSSAIYDVYGNVLTTTDTRAMVTRTVYDSLQTFPVSVTRADGTSIALTETTAYDPAGAPPGLGLPATRTDANGEVATYQCDALGRPTQVTGPGGLTDRQLVYSLTTATKYVQALTLEDSQTGHRMDLRNVVDGLGRTIRTALHRPDNQWTLRDTFYDGDGRVLKKSLPYLAAAFDVARDATRPGVAFTYDPLNRALTQSRPDEAGTGLLVRTTAYPIENVDGLTGLDWGIRWTDERGNQKEAALDAYGNTATVAEHTGTALVYTRYSYDQANRLAGIAGSDGGAYALARDTLGRIRFRSTPNAGTWENEYDTEGNLIRRTDANGNVLDFGYDLLGRALWKDGTPPGETRVRLHTFYYDQGAYARGRLSAVSGTDRSDAFGYDQMGRIVRRTQTEDGHPFVIGATPNALGSVKDLTYPDGEVVSSAYLDGMVQSVTGSEVYLQATGFTASSKPALLQFGDGSRNDYAYYANDLLKSLKVDSGQTLNLTYQYDPASNVKDVLNGLDPARDEHFTYDALNRLASASGAYGTPAYGYGDSGNLTLMEGQAQSYTDASHPHAVTSSPAGAHAYDANGNAVSVDQRTLIYDVENRLVSVKQGAAEIARYAYDADGRRVKKVAGTQTTYFVYDAAGMLIAEAGADGALSTKYIYAGSVRIAQTGSDGDGDGVPDAQDNCPTVANANQIDGDSDGLGDTCDPAPNNPDADGDGLGDGEETFVYGTNPSLADTDGDGLSDGPEVTVHGTDPLDADTDDDGYSDGQEVAAGSNPLDPNSVPSSSSPIPALNEWGALALILLLILAARKGGRRARALVVLLAFLLWDVRRVQAAVYSHQDHLGGTRLSTSGAGVVVERVEYRPYGVEAMRLGAFRSRHAFAGAEFDQETGFYYFGGRYYNPATGRFLQVDVVVLALDAATFAVNPQRLNGYTYALNRPVNDLDVSGALSIGFQEIMASGGDLSGGGGGGGGSIPFVTTHIDLSSYASYGGADVGFSAAGTPTPQVVGHGSRSPGALSPEVLRWLGIDTDPLGLSSFFPDTFSYGAFGGVGAAFGFNVNFDAARFLSTGNLSDLMLRDISIFGGLGVGASFESGLSASRSLISTGTSSPARFGTILNGGIPGIFSVGTETWIGIPSLSTELSVTGDVGGGGGFACFCGRVTIDRNALYGGVNWIGTTLASPYGPQGPPYRGAGYPPGVP